MRRLTKIIFILLTVYIAGLLVVPGSSAREYTTGSQPTNSPLNQAKLLLVSGKLEEAVPVLSDLIEESPFLVDARVLLADAYIRMNRLEDAEGQLKVVGQLRKNFAPQKEMTGRIAYLRKNFDEAVRFLNESLALDKSLESAHLYR